MALKDWTFELKPEPADPGCLAVVDPIYGQRHAAIWVAANFRSLGAELQRDTIIHELIHCHLAALQSQLDEDIVGKGSAWFRRSARRNLEYAVDGLERALAQHFPLIGWPKEATRAGR